MILAEQEETWPFDLQISIWTLQTQQRTPTDNEEQEVPYLIVVWPPERPTTFESEI